MSKSNVLDAVRAVSRTPGSDGVMGELIVLETQRAVPVNAESDADDDEITPPLHAVFGLGQPARARD